MLGDRLNFLGTVRYIQSEHNVTLIYSFNSEYEPISKLKLKIEINSFEHFHIYDLVKMKYSLKSRYFSKECSIQTYSLEELLATKLRALYQRKKGRVLFDIYYSIKNHALDIDGIVFAFNKYLSNEGHRVSSKKFISNLSEKNKRS